MILIIVTLCAVMYITLKAMYNMFFENDEEQSKPDPVLDYDIIDEISRERERAKNIEDVISTAEAYSAGEHEKAVTISVPDATGNKNINAFISPEFLKYIYSEREKARTSLKESIKKMR